MIPAKSTSRFVLRLGLIYGILSIPWPGVRSGYTALFQTIGNSTIQDYGGIAAVTFRPPPTPQARWDTEIHVRPLGSVKNWHLEMSAHGWGYLPVIAFVALALAWPVPFRAQWFRFVLGLLFVQVFVLVRILIAIHYTLHWGGAIKMGQNGSQFLTLLFESISASPVATFVVPACIWLALIVGPQLRVIPSTTEKSISSEPSAKASYPSTTKTASPTRTVPPTRT